MRREILARRAAMSAEERRDASRRIAEILAEFGPFVRAQTVALYLSVGDEVDTWGILDDCLARGQVVYAPRIERGHRLLLWGRVRDVAADLEPGPYRGILQPRTGVRTEELNPEVVLVPGVAFDPDGFRVGYGGGYYDRVLALWSSLRVGLAFRIQVIERVPREEHDLPVDWLVTEAGLQKGQAGGR